MRIVVFLVALMPTVASAQLHRDVEQARGLTFRQKVESHELSRAALRLFLERNFKDSYGDGLATQKAWKALGLIPQDAQLRAMVLGNKVSGVLGFYLFKPLGPFPDGRLYSIPENIRLHGTSTREVQAHELAHALSDQHHDLEALTRALPTTPTGERHADRSQALFSLEEGVAMMTGLAVDAGKAVPHGLENWLSSATTGGSVTARDFPKYSASKTYIDGGRFVHELYKAGGWKAIEAAYADPPTSSEQILHPERYLAQRRDHPTEVAVPDATKVLPGRWRQLQANTLGEHGYRYLNGLEAADGWDGDQYVTLENVETGKTLALMGSTWDSPHDASEHLFATAQGDGSMLAKGEVLYAEHSGREVRVVAKAQLDQVAPLQKVLRGTKFTKQPQDQDSPSPSDPGATRLVQLVRASSGGRALIMKDEAGRLSRVVQFELTPEGLRIAALVLELFERGELENLVKIGPGRFLIREEAPSLIQIKDGVLTMGSGSDLDAIAKAEAQLRLLGQPKTPPPAPAEPTRKGMVGALPQ